MSPRFHLARALFVTGCGCVIVDMAVLVPLRLDQAADIVIVAGLLCNAVALYLFAKKDTQE